MIIGFEETTEELEKLEEIYQILSSGKTLYTINKKRGYFYKYRVTAKGFNVYKCDPDDIYNLNESPIKSLKELYWIHLTSEMGLMSRSNLAPFINLILGGYFEREEISSRKDLISSVNVLIMVKALGR